MASLQAPDEFASLVAPLPAAVQVASRLNASLDVLLFFTTDAPSGTSNSGG